MMSRDPDQGVTNPYGDQTAQNTDPSWLAGTTPVDVDLDGLREYAKHLSDASMDLSSQQGHLMHLLSMPNDAWSGRSLGEAEFVRSQMMANASELTSYLAVLGLSLMNIGNAAQTVADIYHSADGMSAASMNDVLFAFGVSGADRPDGLPKKIGQTYEQAVTAGAAGTATAPQSGLWGTPTTTILSQYETRQKSIGPGGQTREISTTTSPWGGPVVETTVVRSADGKVLSTTSSRTYNSYNYATKTSTETVESYTGDQLTGKAVTATTHGSDGSVSQEATTNYDGTKNKDGTDHVSGKRDESVDQTTKVQTETTSSVDKDNKSHETDRVVIGAATPGQTTVTPPISTEYDPTLDVEH
jgi:hypothetical protein